MHVRDLCRMANQITDYFSVYPKAEAMDGIAKHIHASWEPRMRNALKAHIDAGGHGLEPLFLESMHEYYKGSKHPAAPNVNPTKSKAPKGAAPSFANGGGDG